MAKNDKIRIGVGIIGVVLVLVIGSKMRSSDKPKEREIEGTITAVNVSLRTASVEFVHPKTGQTMTISSEIPPDCDIQIDGKPAQLEDVRVGESARVVGTMQKDKSVTVRAVRITRTTGTVPAAAPATRPAGDTR